MNKKLKKRLDIMLDDNLKSVLADEAKSNNITIGELCRRKLSKPLQDIPEQYNGNGNHESLNERLIQLEYDIVGCQRLIAALIMTIYSSNPNIKGKVNNLTVAQIENIAFDDRGLEDLLMDYIAENKKG